MFVQKRILAAILGQSNEAGNGVSVDRTAAWGYPTADPLWPNGYARSMWPRISEELGRRGVMLRVINTARGSSSIVRHWLGHVKTWAPGSVTYGQLVLSDGKIWRCGLPDGGYSTATNAPTGTADVTGADGVPWIYRGVPAGYEVDGYICKPGDANFSPPTPNEATGYLNRAYTRLTTDPGSWDERWLIISLGQQDALHQTSRADFSGALQTVAHWFTAAGVKVWIGFTCYSLGTSYEARYQANLLPGRLDALAALSSNPLVYSGANLRESLGVLAQEPAPATHYDYAALQNDGQHMNDPAYVLSSLAWSNVFRAAGY